VHEGPDSRGAGERPRIAVSACLAGERVRYDAGHKRDDVVADILARDFDIVTVCPEVETGMGVPREPVELVRAQTGKDLRMIGVTTRTDHTVAMLGYAARRISVLQQLGIAGFVLKSRSPSCGLTGVRTLDGSGGEGPTGSGLFAGELLRRMPLLPVEDEERLADPDVRSDFVRRVRAYHRDGTKRT